MANTLVTPTDLAAFPGGPFSDQMVDIAAADVRAEAGWHIAPEVTETVRVRAYGRWLHLPSRRVLSVASVTRNGTTVTGWELDGDSLHRRSGWSGAYEVTLRHGLEATPQDLLPVLASRARSVTNPRDPAVSQRSVGQVQESYRETVGTATADPVVARYALPDGVA